MLLIPFVGEVIRFVMARFVVIRFMLIRSVGRPNTPVGYEYSCLLKDINTLVSTGSGF